MLDSIGGVSRYDFLLRQFQYESITEEIQQSLDRLCFYLYNHTNVHYFSFVNEKILIAYIKYHRSLNFEIISFKQTIRDVNNFLLFLRNNKHDNSHQKIDLSIGNFNLWTRL